MTEPRPPLRPPSGFSAQLLDLIWPVSCCWGSSGWRSRPAIHTMNLLGPPPPSVGNGLGWLGNLAQRWNWTDGCVAVSNVAMEEIWRAVPNGTPIRIEP